MKNIFSINLILILSIFIFSCGEDDLCEGVSCGEGICVDGTCDCPDGFDGVNCEICEDLTKSIIGTWNASSSLISGQVSFEDDGTLVDTECIIIEYENGGVQGTIKTWELSGDQLDITNMVDPEQGSGFASVTFTVTSFDCNSISMNLGGIINLNLSRI